MGFDTRGESVLVGLVIDWTWLTHADILLFFFWLIVWIIGLIISLVRMLGGTK